MRQPIDIHELVFQPFTAFEPHGALLVSGTAAKANPMTIGWGAFGVMWGKPIAMVMVRPTRYSWQLITKAPDFTINWLPKEMISALNLCGTKSGRDMDKFVDAHLHPVPGAAVKCPIIDESMLVLECHTLCHADLHPKQFLEQSLLNMYNNDFHGMFFGEIVAAAGEAKFQPR